MQYFYPKLHNVLYLACKIYIYIYFFVLIFASIATLYVYSLFDKN